jgi:hypothetical protein
MAGPSQLEPSPTGGQEYTAAGMRDTGHARGGSGVMGGSSR